MYTYISTEIFGTKHQKYDCIVICNKFKRKGRFTVLSFKQNNGMLTLFVQYGLYVCFANRNYYHCDQGDFVAIEMVNRKIRFVWDVGGGIGEITHPMHIQTASDLNNDQHWYRIEAERVHNLGKLLIRPEVVPSGSSLAMGSPHTNMSSAGMGRLDINADDLIWIGGIDKAPLPPYLHSRQHGLIGCLHQVWLDGRPVGLWNFKSQPSGNCSACIEGYISIYTISYTLLYYLK